MERNEIRGRVYDVLVKGAYVDSRSDEHVTKNDSLDNIAMTMDLEDEFGVKISDEDVARFAPPKGINMSDSEFDSSFLVSGIVDYLSKRNDLV